MLFLQTTFIIFASLLIATAPPAPKEEMIQHAILSDLEFNAPHVSVYLNASEPNPFVSTLLRAGIVRVAGKATEEGPHPATRLVLALTENGKRTAIALGWSFGRGMLDIPTGRLVYLPESYRLFEHGRTATLSFKWRYEPNSNLRYLLALGPRSTWPRSMFPNCIAAGRNVSDVPQTRSILIVPDGFGGWSNMEHASYPIRGCASPK
jgi:hypothetical protein